MINRTHLRERVRLALQRSRIVALIGPRQCVKTTLAREIDPAQDINYFDLEDPRASARLQEPMLSLEALKVLVVIDDVQR